MNREDFLQAIAESPDEDAIRLVFADWLEENGDPDRAEFIRLQCEIEMMDMFTSGRRRLLQREWLLVCYFSEKWIRDDRLHFSRNGYAVRLDSRRGNLFRRGFPDVLCFNTPQKFFAAAPRVFPRRPIANIEFLTVYSHAWDQDPWFENTRRFIIGRAKGTNYGHEQPHGTDFPDPEEFRQVVNSPWFSRLKSFTLNDIYCDHQCLRVLSSSSGAQNLRGLDLAESYSIKGDVWGALVEGLGLTNLESLRVDECELDESGLHALVNSSAFPNLRRLSYECHGGRTDYHLGTEGVRIICESNGLPNLQELNLNYQRGGAEGLRLLAQWPGLARITRLELSNFHLQAYWVAETDEDLEYGWNAFVHSPYWGNLRELVVSGGGLEELEALLDGPNLRTLRVLAFSRGFWRYNEDAKEESLAEEAAPLLARCPYLSDDLELYVGKGWFSEDSLKLLRDRFGNNLVQFSDNLYYQPGEWFWGRPPVSTFA